MTLPSPWRWAGSIRTSRRLRPIVSSVNSRSCPKLNTSGPPSSKVFPLASPASMSRAMASARSPTNSGVNFCLPAADQRQGRGQAAEPRKLVEEIILRPEHDGRPQHNGAGKCRPALCLARSLAARIVAGRLRIGPKRRHLDENLGLAAFAALADASAPNTWIASKLWAPRLARTPVQIDHRISPVTNGGQRGRVPHIGLHRHHLPGGLQAAHGPPEVAGLRYGPPGCGSRAWPAPAQYGGR